MRNSTSNTGIYKIVNNINKKYYIGSSVYFPQRWNKHKSELRRGIHTNPYLQNAWNKYGENNFSFETVYNCGADELLQIEQYYLNLLKPTYNLNPCASKPPSPKGRIVKESTLLKQAASHRALHRKMTPENRAKISLIHKGKTCSGKHKWSAVKQISLTTGEVLNTFESVRAAGRYLDSDLWFKRSGGISKCLTGVNETAYGYKWEYLEKLYK